MSDALDSEQNDAGASGAGPSTASRARRLKNFFVKLFSTDLSKTQGRIKVIACVFLALYAVIGGKLIYFGLHQ